MQITQETFFDLAQGNPGALKILMMLWHEKEATVYIRELVRLNIKGWKIWVAYKDLYQFDITKTFEENTELQMEEFKRKLLDGTLLEELKQTQDWKYYESKGAV